MALTDTHTLTLTRTCPVPHDEPFARQVYFYLWEHHLTLLHGMVAEYIARAIKAGMLAQHDHVHEKQLVRPRATEPGLWRSLCAAGVGSPHGMQVVVV